MTPESWCNHLSQARVLDRKKRVRFVPESGWFRVYWLQPRAEVGPFSSIERAWLADGNRFRAQEAYDARRATYQQP
jgi:hypothetical protein